MQPEINKPILSQPAPSLATEYSSQVRPDQPSAGPEFAAEFERAQKAAGKTDAEVRHTDRKQAESAQKRRSGQQKTAESARSKAQSTREQAGEARTERSAKRTTRREEMTADQPMVAQQGEQRAEPVRERTGEWGMGKHQGDSKLVASEASQSNRTNGSAGAHPDAANQGASAAAGTSAQGGRPMAANSTSASQPSAAAAPVAAVAGASTGNQANAQQQGEMGQRAPSAAAKTAGQSAPVESTEAADIMERLIVDREQRMEREASILRQMKAQLAPGSREISMQLSPAALGRVQMSLALREGRFTATVKTETQEAFDALERQLPELQMALESQGFEVVKFDVQMASDFDLADFSDSAREAPALRAPEGASHSLFGDRRTRPAPSPAAQKAVANRGGVDTWV